MKTFKKKVIAICEEAEDVNSQSAYITQYVTDIWESVLIKTEIAEKDLLQYCFGLEMIIEIFNPEREKEFNMLIRLKDAFSDWLQELRNVNVLLGSLK